jgi:UDP-N-acetyl-D-mannosaminuronate dehydrogenase
LTGQKSVQISDCYDLILIATDHDEYKEFDFDKLKVPILDTRNIANGENVFKA